MILILLGSLLPGRVFSSGNISLMRFDNVPADTDGQRLISASSAYPLGISFSAERDYPFYQTAGQSGGSYMMLLGLRYTIIPSLSFDIKFSTGTVHHVATVISSSQSDDGYSLGGVRIGVESRIFPEKLFHPVFSAAYDRITILQNGSGYSGNGVTLHAGYEYLHPSDYFSFQLNMMYQLHCYQPYSANLSPTLNIDTYTQRALGMSLSILIHFRQGL